MSTSTDTPVTLTAGDGEQMRAAMEHFLQASGVAALAAPDAAARSSAAWAESLLCGYRIESASILEGTFDQADGDLVTLSSIPFVSVCSHHLLPFFGLAHVAYQPRDRLLGLGRLEDLVYCLSRRLQLQERLGEEIATCLADGVGASGAACVLEAEHLCVFARGRRQRGPVARTTAFAGELRDDRDFRQQCLALLGAFAADAADETE